MKEILIDLDKVLTEEQIKDTAKRFQIPYAALKAVILTEARSSGYYEGTLIPIVRFENHIFHKKTNGKYAATHPQLSSTIYTNKYNKVGIAEFFRFLEAYKLDKEAAIWSTSWGIGQIMGFNYIACKCEDLKSFMELMFNSERDQLHMMLLFIIDKGLLESLRTQNWSKFALSYNGRDYKKNKYDEKLANFYKQYNV